MPLSYHSPFNYIFAEMSENTCVICMCLFWLITNTRALSHHLQEYVDEDDDDEDDEKDAKVSDTGTFIFNKFIVIFAHLIKNATNDVCLHKYSVLASFCNMVIYNK